MRKGLAASIAKKAGISAAALLAVVVVVGAAALLGGGWYFAGEIENGALVVDWSEPEFDMEVAAIGAGQVTLRVTPETDEDGDWQSRGIWGLERDNGYDQVGAILQLTDKQVVREYIPLSGAFASVIWSVWTAPPSP